MQSKFGICKHIPFIKCLLRKIVQIMGNVLMNSIFCIFDLERYSHLLFLTEFDCEVTYIFLQVSCILGCPQVFCVAEGVVTIMKSLKTQSHLIYR